MENFFHALPYIVGDVVVLGICMFLGFVALGVPGAIAGFFFAVVIHD